MNNAATKWCLTIFHFDDDWKEKFTEKGSDLRFGILGRERCPTSGRDHLQAFLWFRKRRRRNQVQQWCYDATAHCEIARGDAEENRQYCSKDGDYIELGELPQSAGRREKERYTNARQQAFIGNWNEIDDDIFIRHYGALRAINKDFGPRPADLPGVCGVWIWGPPDTGKSHGARELAGDYYEKPLTKWWDGFNGERGAILDDIGPSHSYLGDHLKIWADKYAFIGEIKGGSRRIRPEMIIVTSNYNIEDIWDDALLLQALKRRFRIVHKTEYGPINL